MERSREIDSNPNRLFPRKESNHQHYHQNQNNKNSTESDNNTRKNVEKLNTDPLDDAMKELLDICQLYNEKLSLKSQTKDCTTTINEVVDSNEQSKSSKITTNNNLTNSNQNVNNVTLNGSGERMMTINCDNGYSVETRTRDSKQQYRHESNLNKQSIDKNSSGSIEKLQQRQGELQSQLDEVLRAAKALASKQKRKLSCILEDADDETIPSVDDAIAQNDEEADEDDELLEFQQIENELRISEINRQLDSIQEELRIKLYKRLISNKDTNNSSATKQQQHQKQVIRCSSHANGSSPSSSCSDELTVTTTTTEPIMSSSSSNFNNTSSSNGILTDSNTIASNDAGMIAQQEHNNSFRSYVSDRRHRTSPLRRLAVLSKEHQDAVAAKVAADIAFYAESNNTTIANDEFLMDYKVQGANGPSTNSSLDTPTNNPSDLESMVDSLFGCESAPCSSRDKIFFPTAEVSSSILDKVTQLSDVLRDIADAGPNNLEESTSNPSCSSNHRNNSANSDLEKIEEDEEDCPDFYYSSSERFRSIYEEKLSPMIYGTPVPFNNDRKQSVVDDGNQVFKLNSHPASLTSPKPAFQQATQDYYGGSDKGLNHNHQQIYQHHQQHVQQTHSQYNSAIDTNTSSCSYTSVIGELGNNRSFNATHNSSNNSTGKSNTNRPLTLYLPKPDEEINLVDHIQALGHDLSIISNHLKLDANCAHGYLWKSCSTNSKKWLKRYFFFDRSKKVLSYYKSDGHLVKKQYSAKNFIPFEEISDVYVDHKLSGIGEKDRSSSSKKNNFVFVLATIRRKYVLSCSMAQIMRAWIDIMFTAAKANDFFQQLIALEGDGTIEAVGEDPVYESC